LNPLSNTIVAMLIRMGYVYVLNWNMNTFFRNNSKLRNMFLCVFHKNVLGKDWEHSFIEHDWKHRISKYHHLFKWDVLLNNNINTFYWNNSKLHNILIYVLLSIVTCLTILKITAFLMIFWNVFIHSHGEWSVKCRKDRGNFWNRTIITIIMKIQYFSIHIWLKLLRE
jgi:hypothetical protein